MPRPRKHRCCRRYRNDRVYKLRGVPLHESAVRVIEADAFEALRLCDLEGCDQATAGERMHVSRGTVQRLLKQARQDLVGALVNREAVVIRLTKRSDQS